MLFPIAEVTRGGRVESRHFGAFAVADAHGRLVRAGGDVEAAVFPRSAVKALQSLPLVAEGAAERFGWTSENLALACASHAGTAAHASLAADGLARAGFGEGDLECGAHWPLSAEAARALAAQGGVPSALHNNCSGKHAGFLALARALGVSGQGYVAAAHPVMRRVTGAVASVVGVADDGRHRGVDGCSIPTDAVPLSALAAGFARFVTGVGLADGFAGAARTLRAAVAAHPVLVGGEGRFDTSLASVFGETVFTKVGAEGVLAGGVPALGLGFAIKCADGAGRGAEAACASLLAGLLGSASAAQAAVLERWARGELRNWNGVRVGEVRGLLGE